MPGFILTQSSSVSCSHQGTAKPGAGFPRVKLGGSAVVLQPTPYTISGCPFPPNSGGPCSTGTWTSGSTRVTANKQPLALMAAPGTCVPTGVPMTATQTQSKVRAT